MKRSIFSSFAFLNFTQFLGALNDNIFRLVSVFLGIGLYGEAKTNAVVIGAGGAFVIPFLLFSLPAGTLADRMSKRTILVWMKGVELLVMCGGAAAFYFENIFGAYGILFLMAAQSAVFGPAKYGIVPELVPRHKIAMANGILTGATVVATILGVLFASLLTDLTHRNFFIIGLFCSSVALLGFLASLAIEKTPPAGSVSRIDFLILPQIIRVLKRARTENYLITAILGSAYFYLFGSFVQLNSLPYTIQALGLSDVASGYLFSVASIGIAAGAVIAGKISGKYVELGISPIAGLILGTFFCLTQLGQSNVIVAFLLLLTLGTVGGAFLIPFDAYIQSASLDKERGENISASNFLAFVGVSLSVGLLFLLAQVLNLTAIRAFRVMGVITILISLSMAFRLTDAFVRLIARILFAPKGRKMVNGEELIDPKLPSLFLCSTPAAPIGLLFMIIFQQRYMRLVIERPKSAPLLFQILAFLAKAHLYSESPTVGSKAGKKAKLWLERGYSVTLIPENPDSLSLEALAKDLTEKREVNLLHVRLTAKDKGGWAPPIRAQIY